MSNHDNQKQSVMNNQNLVSNNESRVRHDFVSPTTNGNNGNLSTLPNKVTLPSIGELFKSGANIIEPFQPTHYKHSEQPRSTPFDPPNHYHRERLHHPIAKHPDVTCSNGSLAPSSYPSHLLDRRQSIGYTLDRPSSKARSVSPGFESSEDESTLHCDSKNAPTDFSFLDSHKHLRRLSGSLEQGLRSSTELDEYLHIFRGDIEAALHEGAGFDRINEEGIQRLLTSLNSTRDCFKRLYEHRDDLIRQRAATEPFVSSEANPKRGRLNSNVSLSPEGVYSSGETTSEAATTNERTTPNFNERSISPGTLSNNASPLSLQNTNSLSPPGRQCHQCSSGDTPEWRRGPYGSRTLCNACGLFYTKLLKKYDRVHAKAVMDKRKREGARKDRRIPNLSLKDLQKTLS